MKKKILIIVLVVIIVIAILIGAIVIVNNVTNTGNNENSASINSNNSEGENSQVASSEFSFIFDLQNFHCQCNNFFPKSVVVFSFYIFDFLYSIIYFCIRQLSY